MMDTVANLTARVSQPARLRSAALANWIDRHARLLLTLLIAGYVLVITVAAIWRLHLYDMGFDLALIQQVIWNTLHGRPFETYAYDFTTNLLGTDSFFVLLVFLPFYALFPSPATLLAVETVIVGTSAIPVYLLARDHLERRWAALALAAIYLAYLPVMWGNLYEIRERVMAMAWILWLLLCLERGWYWRMLVPLALALSCRLDTTIGIALVGCYALLRRLPWRFGLTLFASAVAWYLAVTQWIVPSFTDRPGYLFLEHYRYLGDTPLAILLNLVTHPLNTLRILFAPPKLWFLLGMFLPLAFLPLLDWRLLLIMMPLYGLNLVSPRKIQWDVYHHYQGLIVPLMILGAIYGLATLHRRRVFGPHTLGWGVAAMLAGTLLSHLLFGNPLPRMLKRWHPTARQIAANQLVERVPDDAPVAAGNLLAPHLPPRRQIFLVPGGDFYYVADPFARAEYALVDLTKPLEREATEAAIARGGWCVLDTQADYLLIKKQPQARGESCTP